MSVSGGGVMSSNRPYLLRALRDWITDNGLTPQILVDARVPGVEVPPGIARDGKVVLNISEQAVAGLELGNDWVLFNTRFSGEDFPVTLPVSSVLAVYARENGQGMMFAEDTGDPDGEPPTGGDAPDHDGDGKPDRSHLKVVK